MEIKTECKLTDDDLKKFSKVLDDLINNPKTKANDEEYFFNILEQYISNAFKMGVTHGTSRYLKKG